MGGLGKKSGPGERQLAQGPESKHYRHHDIAVGILAAILSSNGAFNVAIEVCPDSDLRRLGCMVYRKVQRCWRGEAA